MIARLRERSPRGRIVRCGLLVSLLFMLGLFLGLACLLVVNRPDLPLALRFLPLPWILAVFLLAPRLRPRCPACGYRFTDAIQYGAMVAGKDLQRVRYCPHCALDLAAGGSDA